MFVPDRDSDVTRSPFADHLPRKVSQGHSRFFLSRLDIGKHQAFLVRDVFCRRGYQKSIASDRQSVMVPTPYNAAIELCLPGCGLGG
jgi:hypothetical protein